VSYKEILLIIQVKKRGRRKKRKQNNRKKYQKSNGEALPLILKSAFTQEGFTNSKNWSVVKSVSCVSNKKNKISSRLLASE